MRWWQLTPRCLLSCIILYLTVFYSVNNTVHTDTLLLIIDECNEAELMVFRRGKKKVISNCTLYYFESEACEQTFSIESIVQAQLYTGQRWLLCVLTANYRQSGNQVPPFAGSLSSIDAKAWPLEEGGGDRYLLMCLSVFAHCTLTNFHLKDAPASLELVQLHSISASVMMGNTFCRVQSVQGTLTGSLVLG